MVINKKMIRTMRENKAVYLGSLFLIIISCLLFTMFKQLVTNMTEMVASFEKDYVQEDASFIADKKIADLEAIESKFKMRIEETGLFDYSLADEKTLRVFSQNTKVNLPAIIEGKGLGSGNILIDPAYAAANQLAIGDSLKIFDKDFEISGFMSLPNYIYPTKSEGDLLNDPNSFGIAVINKADFRAFGVGSSFYAVKFNGGEVAEKTAQFKDTLKSAGVIILKWTNIGENSRVTMVKAKIEGQKTVSSTVPVAILLITCILTGVVMWRMLKKEFSIIGTLYALGYRKREIMKHYLMYPLSIALAGGIIGTALGAFTLRPMLNLMVMYFNLPTESAGFSIQYVIISILLPVIFLGISGWLVVNKALKYSPLELMRGGKDKGKVSILERKLKLEKLKFSTKFKVREQLRSIPRGVFLLLGVIVATMLLLYGFAAKSSIDSLVQDTYEDTLKYEYQYLFNSLQQGEPASGEAFSVSPFYTKSDDKISLSVYGIKSASEYISLKDKTGNRLSADQVIITRPLADRLGVNPGETVQVINKLDSREYAIRVGRIAETYAGENIYMELAEFNALLAYPTGSYFGLWSDDKIDLPESKLLNTTTIDDFKKAFDSVTEPMRLMLGIISFLSFIIGLLVIYVVTSLIIEENRESISLMKVLGYKKKEIYSLVLNSPAFIIVLGYALGIPLLLASLRAMFNSVSENMNFSFPVTINYSYVIIGFVVIYLAYEISKFFNRKKIDKISMVEALKAGLE